MKTTNQNKTENTLGDSANQPAMSKAQTEAGNNLPQSAIRIPHSDNRLPIDLAARRANRSLPLTAVLTALRANAPTAHQAAQVVGHWVWVHFAEQPAAEIRQTLAQLGFHWNGHRQTWQHPYGRVSFGTKADPRDKYTTKPATAVLPSLAH